MRARGRRQEVIAKGRYLVTRQLFLLYFRWRDLLLGGSHHKLWSTFFFLMPMFLNLTLKQKMEMLKNIMKMLIYQFVQKIQSYKVRYCKRVDFA